MSKEFAEIPLPSFLQTALQAMNINTPTDIQAKMIPEALAGQTVVARSQTGTGKTLAYLLPMLAKVKEEEHKTQALVLVPTQELAMQIFEVAKALTAGTNLTVGTFIGGANIKRQVEKLKKQKPHVAIGTPGRLLELIELKKLKVQDVTVLAVDEVDRMRGDAHAWQAFEQVAKRVGRECQYLFVSATLPENFTEQISDYVSFPVQLEAEGSKLETERVKHYYVTCEERERIDVARKVIHHENIKRGIVFVNRLEKVAETTEKLNYRGIKAAALSSDQSKQEREHALNGFRQGTIQILVASDVAARGLDVEDVTHIIQLEAPSQGDMYLHRAGRTGRMGKSGKVITLLSAREMFKLKKYETELGLKLERRFLAYGKLSDQPVKTKQFEQHTSNHKNKR
ncbi:DEAD/DEAH box helicase [Halalkalibacterium ligniniphilum]|uniref:DEAD/DEAH box helicase n=1 Tax=Halalkalibacterium ligniniphilum TaxID=1134413 RepID=UPI0003497B5C|nr:DEAD/DEAH box helicase [Halalkalibacterium ligniniphilum]